MRSYRPNGLQGLPVAIKNLLIINIIVFIAQNTIGQKFFNMDNMFALHTIQSPLFKPWQLVTHLFMHGDFWHIAFNMLALVMVGSILEGYWGSKRFLTFYFFWWYRCCISSHDCVIYRKPTDDKCLQSFATK